NMPGIVPHTSTFALTNATLSYALEIADLGLAEAMRRREALRRACNVLGGRITHPAVGAAVGGGATAPETLLVRARCPAAKRVDCTDGAVEPVVLEVFREKLIQGVVLRVRPEVCVEPGQMIGSRSPERRPDQGVVRIEHGELRQQLLSLSPGIGGI